MRIRTALLAGAFALTVGAATAPEARAQGPGGVLRVGMAAQDIGRLDPHFAVSTPDRVVVAWMFNGLVRFKPGSINPAEVEPDLRLAQPLLVEHRRKGQVLDRLQRFELVRKRRALGGELGPRLPNR